MVLGFYLFLFLFSDSIKIEKRINFLVIHYISSHTYLLYDKESKVFELIYIFGFFSRL